MPTLTWDDLEPAADKAFSIWVGQPELRWAKDAWQILTDAGLADYAGDLDRHRAIIRFLALAGIYSDWCDAAWDEYSEPWYSHWCEDLEISAFRIGQLVGAEDDDGSEECDDASLVADALTQLADDARPEVAEALLAHFGNESGLFLSLWRSRELQHDQSDVDLDEDDDDWEDDAGDWAEAESDDEILNEVTGSKLQAFAWISEGCLPYR
jgi:hypothetical protein